MPPNGNSLTITNPLVLYRSLIATNRIAPDPGQHRLALQLQKLYDRLKDYEPTVEYSHRLQQISRAVGTSQNGANIPTSPPERSTIGTRGIWTSLLAQKEKRDSLALTRVLTSHEAAMNLQSPKGLMLHGEVGTGKSMLIDLFADCLPTRKKRRWHFNTFMLDTFSRLEQLRRSRSAIHAEELSDEYSLLWLARDLIQKSPILFLDEFQLPDRAASKILSNLMTSFFQLGGVLIATSNRMPEELAKAAGMEFIRPVSRFSRLGWPLGLRGAIWKDDGPGQKGEFAHFLEVLRARCEVWEMEGEKDYRRVQGDVKDSKGHVIFPEGTPITAAGKGQTASSGSTLDSDAASLSPSESEASLPKYYLVHSSDASDLALKEALELTTSISHPIPWTPTTLTVYGRPLQIPRQHHGVALFTFTELCGAALGPADYITLASHYHTIAITDIPTLTLLQKNEARRFITLLDATYEARCRLLLQAATGPDDLFFPEATAPKDKQEQEQDLLTDAVHPETYSEIHQDLTSPFRPNVSSYGPSPPLAADALEDDPPSRFRRPGSSYTNERMRSPAREHVQAPDFANIGGLTGEDERFAVKRAKSRIWEMCSRRWWERSADTGRDGVGDEEKGWWRPLPVEARHWERNTSGSSPGSLPSAQVGTGSIPLGEPDVTKTEGGDIVASTQEDVFAHEASPFRTTSDPPPKINWTHVWGRTKWGKRAGTWGKGVEGLEERRKDDSVAQQHVDGRDKSRR